MSLGGPFNHLLNNMSSNIVNVGIPIVAAAGNNGGDACYRSPASAPGVITVASSARGDDVSSFTNGGSCVDIFAPGSSVIGADYNCSGCSCTRTISGTSMATPLVSGTIALYLQRQPLLTPSQIKQKLTEDCLKDVLNYRYLRYSLRNTTTNCLLYINSKFFKHCKIFWGLKKLLYACSMTNVCMTQCTPDSLKDCLGTHSYLVL